MRARVSPIDLGVGRPFSSSDAYERYLKLIPKEASVDEPPAMDLSPFLLPRNRMLILGSRRGFLACVAAQLVGSEGFILGLESQLNLLSASREIGATLALRQGWRNLDFKQLNLSDTGPQASISEVDRQFDVVFADRFFSKLDRSKWNNAFTIMLSATSPNGLIAVVEDAFDENDSSSVCQALINSAAAAKAHHIRVEAAGNGMQHILLYAYKTAEQCVISN